VSGAEQRIKYRWSASVRAIADQIPRASVRTTLTYKFLPGLSGGIEYNPPADKVSPLANWLAISETKNRPALILGTSSDRISTPSGQSFYATLSKNLKRETKLPIAPYFGLAYGTYEDRQRSHRTELSLGSEVSFSARGNFHEAPPGVSISSRARYAARSAFDSKLNFCLNLVRRFRRMLSTVRAPLIDSRFSRWRFLPVGWNQG
jgi:hypothetical protein